VIPSKKIKLCDVKGFGYADNTAECWAQIGFSIFSATFNPLGAEFKNENLGP